MAFLGRRQPFKPIFRRQLATAAPISSDTFASAWGPDASPVRRRISPLASLVVASALAFVPHTVIDSPVESWHQDGPAIRYHLDRAAQTAQRLVSGEAFVQHVVVDAPVEAWQSDENSTQRSAPSLTGALRNAAVAFAFVDHTVIDAPVASWQHDANATPRQNPSLTSSQRNASSSLAFVDHAVVDAPVDAWQQDRPDVRYAIDDTAQRLSGDVFVQSIASVDIPTVAAWHQDTRSIRYAPDQTAQRLTSGEPFVQNIVVVVDSQVEAWQQNSPAVRYGVDQTAQRLNSGEVFVQHVIVDSSVEAWQQKRPAIRYAIDQTAQRLNAGEVFVQHVVVDASVEAWSVDIDHRVAPAGITRVESGTPFVAVVEVDFVAAWNTDDIQQRRAILRTSPVDAATIPVFVKPTVDSPVEAWGQEHTQTRPLPRPPIFQGELLAFIPQLDEAATPLCLEASDSFISGPEANDAYHARPDETQHYISGAEAEETC